MCITYLFSTAPATGTFQKKWGLMCLFGNLGAFFSPETMYVFCNCRSSFTRTSTAQQCTKSLLLLSVWNLPLTHWICCPCLFLIHPSRAIQTFRVFSFIFPTLSSLNQGVLTCIFILDVGTIPCLWLSLSPFSGFPVLLYPLNKGEPNLLTLFKMQVAVYWLVI